MYTKQLIKTLAKKLDIDISKFDMKELVMGMDVELEHGTKNIKTDVTGDDPEATFKIVMAHMHELPDYYTRLKKMENKSKNNMNESDNKNKVDRDREMQNWSQHWENTGYEKLFHDEMEKMGYRPNQFDELSKEEKRKLFNTLDKKWESEEEKKKDVNEGKEGISAYAQRMRELAGLAEGNQKKNIKTVEEGESAFEGETTFMAKDMMKSNDKNAVNESENKSGEGFESHQFEQKTIEEGESDDDLYKLDENTIIVLDFLEDEDEDDK